MNDAVKTITEIKNSYKEIAATLPNEASMTKTQLANIYCDAEEANPQTWQTEQTRSAAFAALMLRYWGKIGKWTLDSASLKLDEVEFVTWLSHGLYVAFYYREWRDEFKARYKEGKFIEWKLDENGERIPNPYYYKLDDTAVDKIINRCCFSVRGLNYQHNNYDNHKSAVLADSLDAMIENANDAALFNTGCIEEVDHFTGARCLIEEFIKKNRKLEALILHEIAYDDSISVKRADSGKKTLFDERKVIKNLAEADISLIMDFCHRFRIKEPQLLYDELKSYSNPKLYRKLRRILAEIKNSPKLLNVLIN